MKIFGYEFIDSKKLDKLISDNVELKSEVRTIKEVNHQLKVDLKTVQMLWDIESNNTLNNR